MIVAFCRVHLRQSARLSSYSHMRARAAAAHPPLAPADLDHLMLAGGAHFPGYYAAGPGHMMVTYNINNGVQVSRRTGNYSDRLVVVQVCDGSLDFAHGQLNVFIF